MSYLEYTVKHVPTGLRKILHLNWPLTVLLAAVSGVGFLMLYSVAGGTFTPWAEPQMKRFALGLVLMIAVGMVPIWLWRNLAGVAYFGTVFLLVAVDLFGAVGMGAQRWIELGSFRLQPSELMKITLVMMLAAYYDWLPAKKTSRPLWVVLPLLLIIVPTFLVLKQPDLGTAILLMAAGGGLMFLAGVHWAYFAVVATAGLGLVTAVFQSRGTPWQLLKDYQFRRIDTFIDPEKHTDFIFTTLAEEFGFVGGFSLLGLYALIILFCIASALINKDRFSSLLTLGIALNFFLFFAVNMSMVMGLAPVVGVPLPLVSYGGSAMLVLLLAFGLIQSAHVHRPR